MVGWRLRFEVLVENVMCSATQVSMATWGSWIPLDTSALLWGCLTSLCRFWFGLVYLSHKSRSVQPWLTSAALDQVLCSLQSLDQVERLGLASHLKLWRQLRNWFHKINLFLRQDKKTRKIKRTCEGIGVSTLESGWRVWQKSCWESRNPAWLPKFAMKVSCVWIYVQIRTLK